MRILKKYKLLGIICITCLIITSVCVFSFKNKSSYLLLGDYSSKDQAFEGYSIKSFANEVGDFLEKEKLVDDVRNGYSSNNMTSKKLLEMIESDVYKEDKRGIVDEIKNSKYITITLGINDVLKDIKYDKFNESFEYNKEVIENKIDVFKHNYYKIVEEIKDINLESKIILVGVCSAYDDIVFDNINSSIKEVADYNSIMYVDTDDIKDEYLYLNNKLYLNKQGQECLANKVILKIKENI